MFSKTVKILVEKNNALEIYWNDILRNEISNVKKNKKNEENQIFQVSNISDIKWTLSGPEW